MGSGWYALDAYADNIVLLDTGSAKLMTPYYPLEELRMIPGFEPVSYTHLIKSFQTIAAGIDAITASLQLLFQHLTQVRLCLLYTSRCV